MSDCETGVWSSNILADYSEDYQVKHCQTVISDYLFWQQPSHNSTCQNRKKKTSISPRVSHPVEACLSVDLTSEARLYRYLAREWQFYISTFSLIKFSNTQQQEFHKVLLWHNQEESYTGKEAFSFVSLFDQVRSPNASLNSWVSKLEVLNLFSPFYNSCTTL